jgi:hypothetical protein
MIMKKMRIWRWFQAAQAVAANPASSAISSPTHTLRQSLEVYRPGSSRMRIAIQAASPMQQAVMNSRPNRLRRRSLGSISGCGRSMTARVRAS